MAPSSNYVVFIFLTTLLLPLQITARDSQFFSKVTHFTNNVKEKELPNKEEQPLTNKPEEKQPVFIPETENSYGLYGHDSELPTTPTTTTTTENTNSAPYTTTNSYQTHNHEFEDTSKYHNNKYYNNDAYNNKYYNNDAYNNKYYNNDAYNNNYYNNKDEQFEGNQNELTDTKYTEGEYNSMGNQKYYHNNNNNNAASDRYFYNNENNNYNAANNRYSHNHNADPNRYNGERQGMSDTRYLEGGKYFYDVNYEKNNPTLYSDSSRGVNANNLYNNRGNYYGNNNEYQNQEEFEDEQDVFQP